MPPVETGLSGFIAHGLWPLYLRFPSSGKWDWLLLFIALAAFTHFSFLPLLWRAVKADMEYLKSGRTDDPAPNGDFTLFCWSLASLSFLLWFFHTAAGKAFIDLRDVGWLGQRSLLDPFSTAAYTVLVLVLFVVGVTYSWWHDGIKKKLITMSRTQPFSGRGLPELWCGGGTWLYKDGAKPEQLGVANSASGDQLVALWLLHILYWYWSAASIVLMYVFLIALLLTESARVLFVFIHHKRQFG